MAKHFYHIPLQKTHTFIKKYKSGLNAFTTDKKSLEYYKLLGKSHYVMQVEKFITFFKIDKELDYALKTMAYFNSSTFMEELYKILNFSQFDLERENVSSKDFFYALCYLYATQNKRDFEHFIDKTFLYYHSAFNLKTNINIDYKDMSHTLLKTKKLSIKESFGEEGETAFFKILLNDKLVVEEYGKRIKTLRKKVYKKLFYYLIELEDKHDDERSEAHNILSELSAV